MILHHPVNNYGYAYKMLEKAYREGKLRAIGLSNFPVEKIEEILEQCEVRPMVMQAECHPYYPAEQVKPFLDENGIVLQSWFPLGHGNADMLGDPVFLALADKYKKSPAQIILRWHIQMGLGAVPGSRSKEHIEENGNLFDFALLKEEMEQIAGVNKHRPFYQVTAESLERMATTKCRFEEE